MPYPGHSNSSAQKTRQSAPLGATVGLNNTAVQYYSNKDEESLHSQAYLQQTKRTSSTRRIQSIAVMTHQRMFLQKIIVDSGDDGQPFSRSAVEQPPLTKNPHTFHCAPNLRIELAQALWDRSILPAHWLDQQVGYNLSCPSGTRTRAGK